MTPMRVVWYPFAKSLLFEQDSLEILIYDRPFQSCGCTAFRNAQKKVSGNAGDFYEEGV